MSTEHIHIDVDLAVAQHRAAMQRNITAASKMPGANQDIIALNVAAMEISSSILRFVATARNVGAPFDDIARVLPCAIINGMPLDEEHRTAIVVGMLEVITGVPDPGRTDTKVSLAGAVVRGGQA